MLKKTSPSKSVALSFVARHRTRAALAPSGTRSCVDGVGLNNADQKIEQQLTFARRKRRQYPLIGCRIVCLQLLIELLSLGREIKSPRALIGGIDAPPDQTSRL